MFILVFLLLILLLYHPLSFSEQHRYKNIFNYSNYSYYCVFLCGNARFLHKPHHWWYYKLNKNKVFDINPHLSIRYASWTSQAHSKCMRQLSLSTVHHKITGSKCSPTTAWRCSRPTQSVQISVSVNRPNNKSV